MAKKEPVRWITVKGARIPIYEDDNGNEYFGIGKKDDDKANFVVQAPSTRRDEATFKNFNNANQVKRAINDILQNFDKSEDVEDFIWNRIYDYFPRTLPDDQSILVLDNNKGIYDKDGMIGFVNVSFDRSKNGKPTIKLFPSYEYMEDFDDDYLEQMGIYKE